MTLLAGAPASMLYFTSYELTRDSLQNSHPQLKEWSFATHFLAGMVAEAVRCELLPRPVRHFRADVTPLHPPANRHPSLQLHSVGAH